MAYLSAAAVAKLGEAEVQWMSICEMYGKFCRQIGEGIASALVMSLCMLLLSALSAFSLFRLYGPNKFHTLP